MYVAFGYPCDQTHRIRVGFLFSGPRIADPQYRGLPAWLSPAVRSEYYIKIGLVLLGTSVLFGEILEAGFFGILQGIVVVFSVWYFTFWLARKMKVDEEMGVMLSECGVDLRRVGCHCHLRGDQGRQ